MIVSQQPVPPPQTVFPVAIVKDSNIKQREDTKELSTDVVFFAIIDFFHGGCGKETCNGCKERNIKIDYFEGSFVDVHVVRKYLNEYLKLHRLSRPGRDTGIPNEIFDSLQPPLNKLRAQVQKQICTTCKKRYRATNRLSTPFFCSCPVRKKRPPQHQIYENMRVWKRNEETGMWEWLIDKTTRIPAPSLSIPFICETTKTMNSPLEITSKCLQTGTIFANQQETLEEMKLCLASKTHHAVVMLETKDYIEAMCALFPKTNDISPCTLILIKEDTISIPTHLKNHIKHFLQEAKEHLGYEGYIISNDRNLQDVIQGHSIQKRFENHYDIIMVLCADEILYSGAHQYLVELLEKNPRAKLWLFGTSVSLKNQNKTKYNIVSAPKDFSQDLLWHTPFFHISTDKTNALRVSKDICENVHVKMCISQILEELVQEEFFQVEPIQCDEIIDPLLCRVLGSILPMAYHHRDKDYRKVFKPMQPSFVGKKGLAFEYAIRFKNICMDTRNPLNVDDTILLFVCYYFDNNPDDIEPLLNMLNQKDQRYQLLKANWSNLLCSVIKNLDAIGGISDYEQKIRFRNWYGCIDGRTIIDGQIIELKFSKELLTILHKFQAVLYHCMYKESVKQQDTVHFCRLYNYRRGDLLKLTCRDHRAFLQRIHDVLI